MKAVGKALYRLAEAHRATPMAGRSHGVQALPITFGHKAAIWLSEMGRNYERPRQLEPRVFVGGMVGAVGTQASYGPQAPELERRLMKRLGLGVADINWQTAHDLVYEASMHGIEKGVSFERALMRDPRVAAALTPAELKKVLDPTTYVGLAPEIVDSVLAQTRNSGWLD